MQKDKKDKEIPGSRSKKKKERKKKKEDTKR